jgi:hypothetical protein
VGRRLPGEGKKVVTASPEAQHLALVAKHLGADPYEVWNSGKPDLPPVPRGRQYRRLLMAMALWLEERDEERVRALIESTGVRLAESKSLMEAMG